MLINIRSNLHGVKQTFINILIADDWHWLVTTYRVSRCYPELLFTQSDVCHHGCHLVIMLSVMSSAKLMASIISRQTEQTTSQLLVSYLQRNSQQRKIFMRRNRSRIFIEQIITDTDCHVTWDYLELNHDSDFFITSQNNSVVSAVIWNT